MNSTFFFPRHQTKQYLKSLTICVEALHFSLSKDNKQAYPLLQGDIGILLKIPQTLSTLYCAVIAPRHKIIFKLLFLKSNILDWRQINWYNNFYLLPPRYGLVEMWSFPDSHKMSASPKWSYMYYHWLSLILFTPESLRCMKILLSFSITSYLQIYRHQSCLLYTSPSPRDA